MEQSFRWSPIETEEGVTRGEAGKLNIEPQCTPISDAITATLSTMQVTAAGKGIKLSLDVEAGIPPACADPSRVQQILTNLTENAISFTLPIFSLADLITPVLTNHKRRLDPVVPRGGGAFLPEWMVFEGHTGESVWRTTISITALFASRFGRASAENGPQ